MNRFHRIFNLSIRFCASLWHGATSSLCIRWSKIYLIFLLSCFALVPKSYAAGSVKLISVSPSTFCQNGGNITATLTAGGMGTDNSPLLLFSFELSSTSTFASYSVIGTFSNESEHWYQPAASGTISGIIPKNLASGTYYVRIRVSKNNVLLATSLTLTINVNASPTITSTTAASRCGAGPVTLSATASSGNVSWYANATGGASLSSSTSYTTPSLSQTTTYYADVASNACGNARTPVVATIKNSPIALNLVGSTVCSGNPQTITATTSAVGVSYQLYNGSGIAVGSPLSGTGSGFTAPGIPAGTGYYVIGTLNGCSSTSNSVNVVVTPLPTPLVLTGSSVCVGQSRTITTSTSVVGVSYQLYNSNGTAIGSPMIGTGGQLTATGIPVGTGYYVVGTSNSCSSTSNSVDVSEKPLPIALVLTGSTVCNGEITSITSSTSSVGATYQLYNSSNVAVGSPMSGSGSSLSWSSIPAGTGFYVISSLNSCTQSSNLVNVVVNPLPVALVLTGSTVCSGQTTSINSSTSIAGVSYQLYNSSNSTVGGPIVGTGSSLTWNTIAVGTGYYVISTLNTCSATSNAVNVVVNSLPTALVISGSTVCANQTTSILSSSSDLGVEYQLYNSSNLPIGASVSGTGSSLSWLGIAAGKGYYVIGTSNFCSSTSSLVDVTSTPLFTAQIDTTICANQFPFTIFGHSFLSSGTVIDTLYTTVGGCDTIRTINVAVTPLNTKAVDTTICPNQLPFSIFGYTFTAAGTIIDTLASTNSCDTIRTINVSVNPLNTKTVDTTTCPNQLPFSIFGYTFTAAGTIIDTIPGINSCDTIRTINVAVNPLNTKTFDTTIFAN